MVGSLFGCSCLFFLFVGLLPLVCYVLGFTSFCLFCSIVSFRFTFCFVAGLIVCVFDFCKFSRAFGISKGLILEIYLFSTHLKPIQVGGFIHYVTISNFQLLQQDVF